MMSIRNLLRNCASLLLAAPLMAAAETLPDDSIYQLNVPLQSQADVATTLDANRGHPVLISMFYASCGYVCPMLVRSLQQLDRSLDDATRGNLRVLLVSFDPEHDTPQVLAEVADKHKVDTARWTLARAQAADVRKLAAVLGIQYRELPDGGFNHATVISLLGADGRILAKTASPTRPEEDFIAALRSAASLSTAQAP